LQRLTGLTGGNLTSHLAKLEDAGLVTIDKKFVGKTPRTHVSLTEPGRAKVTDHWEQLTRLNAAAQHWQPNR